MSPTPTISRSHRADDTGARQRGSALVVVIMFFMAISLVAASVIQHALAEQRLNHRHFLRLEAKNAAEATVEYGFAELTRRFDSQTSFASDALITNPLELPDSIDAFFDYETLAAYCHVAPDSLVLTGGVIPAGSLRLISRDDPANDFDPLKGKYVLAREIEIYGRATASDPAGGGALQAFCSQVLQVRDAPLFSHAIFYNMDMEIAPGAVMDIYGPVHTNGNLYVQSNTGLYFHDVVTSTGSLVHGRKPGSGQSASSGSVSFVDAAADARMMWSGSEWLDSTIDDWRSIASNRWDGNVQTAEHGIQTYKPVAIEDYVPDDPDSGPDETENPAAAMIENALPSNHGQYEKEIELQKFSNKASLVFEVNPAGSVKAYKYAPDPNGKYLRLVGGAEANFVREEISVPDGLIVGTPSEKFYDYRRGGNVHVVDIDVGVLKSLIETDDPDVTGQWTNGSTTFDPATEWNGIVYVEHKNSANGGVRLVNGMEIPDRDNSLNSGGMTFATNSPLYIKGHYNADGVVDSGGSREPDSGSEPPAAVVGDAITILSPAWSDAYTSSTSLSSRVASSVEISAAFITGIVPSADSTYSGGVENLPRFLENWGGKTVQYRGSMVVLYESEQADEPWGSSNVYSAPNRDWGFNSLFAEGIYPPGTPNIRTYRRYDFRDLTQAEYDAAIAALPSS